MQLRRPGLTPLRPGVAGARPARRAASIDARVPDSQRPYPGRPYDRGVPMLRNIAVQFSDSATYAGSHHGADPTREVRSMRKLAAVVVLAPAGGPGRDRASPRPPLAPKVTVKATINAQPGRDQQAPAGRQAEGADLLADRSAAPASRSSQTFDILFPKGSLYNGAQLPVVLVLQALNAVGPAGCPQGVDHGIRHRQRLCRHDDHSSADHGRQRRRQPGLLLHRPQQSGAGPVAGDRQDQEGRAASTPTRCT